jgi:hypothetical protein
MHIIFSKRAFSVVVRDDLANAVDGDFGAALQDADMLCIMLVPVRSGLQRTNQQSAFQRSWDPKQRQCRSRAARGGGTTRRTDQVDPTGICICVRRVPLSVSMNLNVTSPAGRRRVKDSLSRVIRGSFANAIPRIRKCRVRKVQCFRLKDYANINAG